MTRLVEGDRSYLVHMSHCNMGEYHRSCKYGDHEICPALEGLLPDPDPAYVVKTLIWMAEQIERHHPDYTNNVYRQAVILIDSHGYYENGQEY